MFFQKLSQFKCLKPNLQTRYIFTTSYLLAEPLKKKKRIDPQLLRRREERKIRKLEKEIRRLELTPKQLKPIIEMQLTPQIIKELPQRQRQEVEVDSEAEKQLERMVKLWSIYRSEQRISELKSIKSVVNSQKKALNVLREESPQLSSSAISIDQNLIAFESDYVKKETPKLENYVRPDGRRNDIT